MYLKDDELEVERLQKDHGGWNSKMKSVSDLYIKLVYRIPFTFIINTITVFLGAWLNLCSGGDWPFAKW